MSMRYPHLNLLKARQTTQQQISLQQKGRLSPQDGGGQRVPKTSQYSDFSIPSQTAFPRFTSQLLFMCLIHKFF